MVFLAGNYPRNLNTQKVRFSFCDGVNMQTFEDFQVMFAITIFSLCYVWGGQVLLFRKCLRVRFFKKIQDWILKSETIRKWILRYFTKEINPRSFGSLVSTVDSSVALTNHEPRDLGLICLVKKRKIRLRILPDLRIQS